MFWGSFYPKHYYYFLFFDPQKALSCSKTRVLSPYWSSSVLRCDLEAKRRVQKRKNPKVPVRQKSFASQTPSPSPHVNQILHAGSYPGYLYCFWVSETSVGKCGSCVGSKFWPSHWQCTSLIQQLVATAEAVRFTDICSQDKCSQHYLKYGQMLTKFIISFLYLFLFLVDGW